MVFFRNLSPLTLIASVLAAPTLNVTTTTYETVLGNVKVAAEPRGRGTFGIVFSCSATLFFCVWTAIHPNILNSESTWHRAYYKLSYMVVSLIIPEAVVVCAFGQWREAKQLHSAWCTKYGPWKRTWSEKLMLWRTSNDSFGIDGAFFVLMGGFVVESSIKDDSSTETQPEIISQLLKESTPAAMVKQNVTTTLTPGGFLKYLDEGYIHDGTFDRRSIVDKGKTSNIAKSVASVQALWLLVQCTSRWASDLPLTLLEIHVAIQVMCTMVLYACWWSKPLDVNHPITIVLQRKPKDESSINTFIPELRISELEENKSDKCLLKQRSKTLPFITLRSPSCLIAVVGKAFYEIMIHIVEPGAGKDKKAPLLAMLAEGFLVFIIGALHAAAWNVHFPTNVERWLWRGSSISMCFFPPVIVFIVALTKYEKDLIVILWKMQLKDRGFWRWLFDSLVDVYGICARRANNQVRSLWFFLQCCMVSACVLLFLTYATSIMFITVESYISVRDPPDGSFLTPVWGDYWPHL